jgi:segregation and condensation protein B
MRRGSNKSIRVSNRRNIEMEEEKQHEAATPQPAKEVLAEERLAQELSAETTGEAEQSSSLADGSHDGERAVESANGMVREDGPAEETTPPEVTPLPDERFPDSEAGETPGHDAEMPPDDLLSDDRSVDPDADERPQEPSTDASALSEASINAYELIGSTEAQATEAETDAATLKAVLEAIVYVLPEPVPAAQIAAALNQPTERVESILRELMIDTAKPERGVFIREVAGGYQVATKPEHHEAIRNFVKNLKQPLKLSGAALETLAVIAYKQPVTAPEIMEIRGVQGVGVLKTLLERKMITTAGRKNVIGKPILYKTTKEFLTQFGLNRVTELPTLKEFEEIRRQSISDEDMEERPEAHPSAPLLEQAAELDERADHRPDPESDADASIQEHSVDKPPGEPTDATQERVTAPPEGHGVASETVLEPEPHAESESEAEAEADAEAESDPQSEAPPTPESGPEAQENHG